VLISCIIPTRNRPEFVIEAAASVLAQSHSELELIIVNDGATPVAMIADARARIIDSGKRGAVPARNLGLMSATGEAIAWLDDDDVWTDTNFLTACVEHLRSGRDFVFADGALVFPDGTRKAFAHDATAESLTRDNTILISAVCYRRGLHAEFGQFDEALPYYWDWDWYLRVVQAGKLLTHIKAPVVDIRIHAQNMSGFGNSEARSANLQLLCAKHRLPEIPLKSHVDFVDGDLKH
jgi:glycosyltransferase involved in cell wall biosynthesis